MTHTMKDVLGQAIADHYYQSSRSKLWVHSRWDPRPDGRIPTIRELKENMPVKTYFREADDLPELEWIALQHCAGSILDIGAGAGSHALLLQQMGQKVTALDISPLAAKVMKQRGVRNVLCKDFFKLASSSGSATKRESSGTGPRYDTLLLLMNGIGLAGTLAGLHIFLQKARTLLNPGGSLIFDSCDIAYLYQHRPPSKAPYYGEVFYQYEYRRVRTDWFNWLFIDRRTLRRIATKEGWKVTFLFEDRSDQYLVNLAMA